MKEVKIQETAHGYNITLTEDGAVQKTRVQAFESDDVEQKMAVLAVALKEAADMFSNLGLNNWISVTSAVPKQFEKMEEKSLPGIEKL